MSFGTITASLALLLCSIAPGFLAFAVLLVFLKLAANLVQYGAAFALLVQLRPLVAARSITYLTLIAGFASTLFWPVTSALNQWFTWQEVYQLYAGLNFLICLPAHLWLANWLRRSRREDAQSIGVSKDMPGVLPPARRARGFVLMAIAFSLQALLSSAVLVHMVPLLSALGLGSIAVLAGSLFGPSQVASRFINMLLGRDLSPLALATSQPC